MSKPKLLNKILIGSNDVNNKENNNHTNNPNHKKHLLTIHNFTNPTLQQHAVQNSSYSVFQL